MLFTFQSQGKIMQYESDLMLSLGVRKIKSVDKMGIPDYLKIALGWFERYEKTGENFALSNYHHYIRVAEEFGLCEVEDPITFE